MASKEIENVLNTLGDLKGDNTVPKNVRLKIEGVIGILNNGDEAHIKLNKALSELEEIAEDVNLQSYTRTQVWDIISNLEKFKS